MNAQENFPHHHLLNRELRHLECSKLTRLSSIIDKAKAWNRLLKELTKPEPNYSIEFGRLPGLQLSLEAINIIEQQFHCGKSPTLTLINHWSITGRRRPTVRVLLGYLLLCDLKQAADCVCQSIFDLKSVEELLLRLNKHEQQKSLSKEYRFSNLQDLVQELEPTCSRYPFDSILKATRGFCNQPFNSTKQTEESGAKIGEGRFSSVYRAEIVLDGQTQVIAAKLLKSECNKKCLTNEINLISKVKNDNILQLLGIALGGEVPDTPEYICLIYDYMRNGSLLDCLSEGLQTKGGNFLNWPERFKMSISIAEGISYLHQFSNGPIIHRDIKTANIFIDANLKPKVGDFSLLRQLDTIRNTQYSQNVMGTSVYMPPEAFRGDLSIKFDTFSFGVVLLELLTGLKPFNADLDEDLLTFINEKLSDIEDELTTETTANRPLKLSVAQDRLIEEIADKKAGSCSFDNLRLLFKVALQATEINKKSRPEMTKVRDELKRLEAAQSSVE